MRDLPGGGVLIGAEKGLFIAPALPLSDATVKSETEVSALPLRSETVRLSFLHPCASVSDHLGLRLTSLLSGTTRPEVAVAFSFDTLDKDRAILSAPIKFPVPGNWTLQLRQGTTAVGSPIPIPVTGPSIWERLASAWQIVVGVASALYIALFALLLLATRYSTRAFAILNDAVWAKLVTWPFFLLRHVPAVQRWVLEPWFHNVRDSTRRDARFVDPPISSSGREPMTASSMLSGLRGQSRLWLQGRSGMGKTSVFAAWERAYFASPDAKTLHAAARKHGFMLVMLPVRYFADVPPPMATSRRRGCWRPYAFALSSSILQWRTWA
jgi:hypothetical protein